jgi:predicted NUDIX family phosphoesterase
MGGEERVLCVRTRTILGSGSWRGLLYGDVDQYLDLIAASGDYQPRSEVEDDPSWKQVIPYLVLRDRGRIFLMRRTRSGADARLHERWSVGIGGHVNPEDGGLAGGLLREWTEELVADWHPDFRMLGLLNDDSDPVGRVHLGVVFSAEAAGREVGVRETDKLAGTFVAPRDVLRVYDRLETWSSLLYDYVTGRAAGARVERHPGTRVG